MPPKTPMKFIIGSVACGRLDPLLKSYLATVTVNFPFICGVYEQVYAQLEQMFQAFVGDEENEDSITQFVSDRESEGETPVDMDSDAADDAFLNDVLPALADNYPEDVELQKLPLAAFERIPAVHRIIERKGLSAPERRSLQKQLEHAVLEEVTTTLVDIVLQELEIPSLDDLEHVDVSQCIEQRIRKLIKLR